MKKLVQSLFLLLFVASIALAQDKKITGKVTSSDDGLPLPGVSVKVTGSNLGTQTDVNGNYAVTVPSTAKSLTFSFIGFKSVVTAIGKSPQVSVRLESDASALSEVVVVGYGGAKKAENVVGSVVSVSGKIIQDRPVANAFDALQGRVAGLQVFTSSGEPSATSSVRLQGVGSLGASSTPLYLLDGIQVDGGTIVSLNPNDIENISVLKDASATSIYGSRAANGVIAITTKKGQTGASTIRISSQYGVSNLANTDYFDQFMNTKELTDFWIETGFQTQTQINTLLAANPNDFEWYKFYYRDNAPTLQNDVSISGGGGKTTYYVSASQFAQEGLAFRSNFDRYTLRSNITSKVNNWMELGLNLYVGTDERQLNPYGSNSTNRGLLFLAQPYFSPYDANGDEYPNIIPGWGRYNPRYLANNIQSQGNNLQFNPSGYIQLTPVKNLTIRAQGGVDSYDYLEANLQLPSFVGSLNNGNASRNYTRGISKTLTSTAEYKYNYKTKNNFGILAGYEYNDGQTDAFGASSTGQTDDRLTLLASGPANRNVSESFTEYTFKSFFGRFEYNYNNKYFFDASLRQDESSRFGANNRKADFYSVGALWKIKEESFLKDVKWLTGLSLKASTGTSGNSAIGNYQSQALVGNGQFDGATTFGVSTPGNANLAWETQQKTTVGVRANFLDKINVELEYYNRVTDNMLINVPFPFTSGFTSITSNVGSLKNYGIDLAISYDILKKNKNNAYITPYINLNYNQNEITELFQGRDFYIIPNTGVSWAVGEPVAFFYPVFSGINPANGNAEWFRPNADPNKIAQNRQDPADVTNVFNTAALQQNTGIERYPPLNGGFGFASGIKGFYLSADFSFSSGKYLINNDQFFFANPGQFPGFNQSEIVRDYWKQPGDNARFPRNGVQFSQFDSRLIQDASFMRLKTLNFGYQIPAKYLQKTTSVIKGVKLFVVGRNLLTFTKYEGPDPEVDSNIGLGTNPNTKQTSFGLELTF
jgi:TonB-linked SusC/RagA family outer membrane protein